MSNPEDKPAKAAKAKKPAAKKAPKKKPEIIRENITAPYHFTDKEKQELGSNLAALITKRGEIEQEKAQVMSQYGSRLKEVAAQIGGLSNKITSGVEPREMRVVVEYDTKNSMKKFFTDDKKHSLVREEPMTPGDWQLPMFKPEEIAAKPPATPPPAAPAPKAGKPAKAPKSSPAGETNVGDALDSAAAGTQAKKFFLDLDSADWTAEGLMNEFKRAAKKAKWTPVQISALADRLKEAPAVQAMIDTLRPHVAQPEVIDLNGVNVPRLDVEIPDGFTMEKATGVFRKAAKAADWPEAAIDEVVAEAERQARVIGDEPEATQAAANHLRGYAYAK